MNFKMNFKYQLQPLAMPKASVDFDLGASTSQDQQGRQEGQRSQHYPLLPTYFVKLMALMTKFASGCGEGPEHHDCRRRKTSAS